MPRIVTDCVTSVIQLICKTDYRNEGVMKLEILNAVKLYNLYRMLNKKYSVPSQQYRQ